MNNTVIAIEALNTSLASTDIVFYLSIPEESYKSDLLYTINGKLVLNTGDSDFLNRTLSLGTKIVIEGNIVDCDNCKFMKEYFVIDTDEVNIVLNINYYDLAISYINKTKLNDREYLFTPYMNISTEDTRSIYHIYYDNIVLEYSSNVSRDILIETIDKDYGSGLTVKFNIPGIYTIKQYSRNIYNDISVENITTVFIPKDDSVTDTDVCSSTKQINYIEWE